MSIPCEKHLAAAQNHVRRVLEDMRKHNFPDGEIIHILTQLLANERVESEYLTGKWSETIKTLSVLTQKYNALVAERDRVVKLLSDAGEYTPDNVGDLPHCVQGLLHKVESL
jgi:hypothetical protein